MEHGRTQTMERASKWSVLREFRGTIARFSQVSGSDMTQEHAQKSLENMFAVYYSTLKSQSARKDMPECLVYRRLGELCSPKIFSSQANGGDFQNMLSDPIRTVSNPLYALSRRVQNIFPGATSLKEAPILFEHGELPHHTYPVILEYRLEKDFPENVLRVPMVLTGDPTTHKFTNDMGVITEEVANILSLIETNVRVEVNHLPPFRNKAKDVVRYSQEAKPLDWPKSYPRASFETPIAAVLLDDPKLSQQETVFESIAISTEEVRRVWGGVDRGPLGRLRQNVDVWQHWSFKNALDQVRNLTVESAIQKSAKLALDIFGVNNIHLEMNRIATLGVHLPMLTMATFTQVLSSNTKYLFDQRWDRELNSNNRFW